MRMDKAKYRGLTKDEVITSRSRYGDNSIPRQKGKSFFRMFASNFGDPIIKILIAALALNIVFMLKDFNLFETVGIVIAILTATLVSTVSEYGSEKAFEKLRAESENVKCRVIRDGITVQIPENDIVCGDIVKVSYGERIPADGKIIDGALGLDMSSLNGESEEVRKYPLGTTYGAKTDDKDVLLRGSVITSGEGIMLVESVGADTVYGKLAGELQAKTGNSPLKEKLTKLAKQISRIGYVAAALVAVGYLFNELIVDSGFTSEVIVTKLSNLHYMLDVIIHTLTLAITIIVVAVPEGLPMMITVVLSANMKKMLADNILVRKLVGIETAGSLNILFCDKTGTLTTGEQSVESFIDGRLNEYKTKEELYRSPSLYRTLYLCAFLNTDSAFSGGRAAGGNMTDRALIKFFGRKNGAPDAEIISKVPFDSEKKYSAVTIKEDGRIRTFIKGAPEYLIDGVSRAYDPSGRKTSAFDKEAIRRKIRELTSDSKRVLMIVECGDMPDDIRKGEYTLAAVVSMRDKLRKDAAKSVRKLKDAGIHVVMITGDNKDTAVSIAKECGIIGDFGSPVTLTGDQISKMSDRELSELISDLSVVARALPSDKTRLVRAAQSRGLVAGMTGDGVNDAPALKTADVGFAMGGGTEVAKEAGDIVMLDNDLSYIVKTVIYGRTIFKSIRKFIIFQLTMNMCAVGVSLIGPFIGIDTPVTVIQMLWINIIMDTLGGLAFAGEPALENVLREKPKKRSENLVNKYMAGQIVFGTVITVAICVIFLTSERIKDIFAFSESPKYFMSAFFCLFIFLGIANCFIARSPRINFLASVSKNKPFVIIMLIVTVIQLLMVYFGGSVFRAAPLSPKQLAFVAAIAILTVLIETVRRVLLRVSGKSYNYI